MVKNMEIKVLEEKKDYIRFNLIGETHTFGNILREELNNSKDIDFATYRREHPSEDFIEFIVQAKKDKDVKKIINGVIDNIEKSALSFKEIINSQSLDEDE